MRILLVNKYWRDLGGVENHAFFVRDWLESRGHTVVPFAMDEPESEPSEHSQYFPSPVEFRVGGLRESVQALERATFSSDSRKGLKRLLAEQNIDAAYVLHVYHQLGTALLNDLHAAGVPTVLSIHDYKVACPNYRLFSERTGEICTRCLDSKSAYLTAPIREGCWNGSKKAGVALSVEAMFTRVRKSYRMPQAVLTLNSIQERAADVAGVDPERVIRIAHPVLLGSDRESIDRNHFVYIGRLVPEKGVDILIRAVAASGTRLVIAGDGRSRAELEGLTDELGADVEFVGSVGHEAAQELMKSAIALVVPSTWHEVSPLVVYEAISGDVPVIATAVGGMIDQIDQSRGYLVRPSDVRHLADTLVEVDGDQAEARRRSKIARSFANEHWSLAAWERTMRAAFQKTGVTV